jgi:hypothetical protein
MKPMNEAVAGSRNWLVDRVRRAVAAGDARLVLFKCRGSVVVEVPLTTSIAGLLPAAVLVPRLTAAAAIVALLAGCTVEVVPATPRP